MQTCAISSPRVEDIYTQGIGGESVDRERRKNQMKKKFFITLHIYIDDFFL